MRALRQKSEEINEMRVEVGQLADQRAEDLDKLFQVNEEVEKLRKANDELKDEGRRLAL
jgi:Zn finger protein HypA/HybF involved in hydrogenase expression